MIIRISLKFQVQHTLNSNSNTSRPYRGYRVVSRGVQTNPLPKREKSHFQSTNRTKYSRHTPEPLRMCERFDTPESTLSRALHRNRRWSECKYKQNAEIDCPRYTTRLSRKIEISLGDRWLSTLLYAVYRFLLEKRKKNQRWQYWSVYYTKR